MCNMFFPCVHRKETLGLLDCNCQGIKEIYKCDLMGMCAIRKLRPGVPNIKLESGEKISRDISYCNSCDKRVEP